MLTLLFPSLERGIVNLQIVAAPGVPPSVHSDADPFIFTSYDSLRGGVVVEGAPRLGLVSLAVRTNQVVVESHAYKSHQFNPLLDHACEWQHTPLESRSMLAVPLPARGRPDAALGAIVLVNKLRPGAAGRGPPHGSSSGHDELLEEGFGDNDAADLQAVATLVSLALESCDELLPWLRAIDAPAYVPAETGETSEAELGA
jgi:GAF domain-containing protein